MHKEKFDKYRVKRLSRESVEAEEIFLDSEKLKKSPESEREKMEFPIKKGKVHFLYFLIIVLLLILFVKTINLQIVKGEYWRNLAEENRLRSYPIKALRGIIYDRNNKPLVSNEPRFDLRVVPADLLKQESQITEIFVDSKEEIEALLKENANLSIPITIKTDFSRETALILESKFAENPAVSVEIASQRNYIDGPYFSHVLGYVGKINPEEYKKKPDYFIDDYIGKIGLEFYYEDILRGSYGEKLIEVDSRGKIKNVFGQKKSRSGKSIFLSIDGELQKKLYDEIKKMLWGLKTNKAAGIALDPNTGEILALVSFPSFDNNKVIAGLSEEFNRTISGTYPPGSTIKPLIAVAALKENIINPQETIYDTGSITVYSKYFPNISYTFHDWKAHGFVNMAKAIAESCNVYFYTVGGGYGKIEGVGIEKISQYLRQFGLGNVLGIDLPQETGGLIPDENWKRENKNEDWYIGDTYNVSIGQGDILATPLQIALATAVIANDGTLFKPQLTNKIGDEKISPQVIRNDIADQETLEIIRKGMREAVIYGSAKYLYDLPVKVAGKTGTAQAPRNKAPHSWFTSFAPYENPEIVLTILVENGGEGSAVAAPIAKEVLRWYFSR